MADEMLNAVQPRAQSALANCPVYELRDLLVERQQNGLLISGRVSSFYHKQLAQEIVRCVCADIDVFNAVRVDAGADAE